jgi:hypothetical protein
MTHRGLRWLALFFWIAAAVNIDTLRGLPGMIARHHAGIVAPWVEYARTACSLLLAILFTALCLKGLGAKRNLLDQKNVS